MPECARCGDFTDNPAAGQYHYCDACTDLFDAIRSQGVVVTQANNGDGYEILVTVSGAEDRGGHEDTHVEALARGKLLADELGADALFEYDSTGSRWVLENYLDRHPAVNRDVEKRLQRVPEDRSKSLLGRLRSLF